MNSGGVIYRITCTANGRVYIGSTRRDFNQRRLEHLHYLRKGNHHALQLQRCFSKYGEDAMSFDVIEFVEDANFVHAREQFQLWRHSGNLLNGTQDVSPGVNFTPEVRAKMSASRKARESKPCSDETKAKISLAKKGRASPRGVEASVAARTAFIAEEVDSWIAMLAAGKSYREIERITGRCRNMVARECKLRMKERHELA